MHQCESARTSIVAVLLEVMMQSVTDSGEMLRDLRKRHKGLLIGRGMMS